MNQAIFEKLYVYDNKVTEAVFNVPFDELLIVKSVTEAGATDAQAVDRVIDQVLAERQAIGGKKTSRFGIFIPEPARSDAVGVLARSFYDLGSIRTPLVGEEGIEPSIH